MQSRPQQTLKTPVTLSGVGLHTGLKSKLSIIPASENTGILFIRTDLDRIPTIQASVNNVVETNRGTVLLDNGVKVSTVEHVLSALYASGVDNAKIEISGPEPPILDGSALPYVNILNTAGIKKLNASQDIVKIDQKIQYVDFDNDIKLTILPHDNFKITFFMDYGLSDFGLQYSSIENVELDFAKEIAPARTFGLLSEISLLKKNNLIKGGSLDNAVVFVDREIDSEEQDMLIEMAGKNIDTNFKKGSILNAGGLRFDNEPVRHKVLDLIGDLSLFGKPIFGHVIANKSGHGANIELVKLLSKQYHED